MVTAGEKPGTGFYFCVQCGHRAYLEIGTDRLPPCTKCLGHQFNNGRSVLDKLKMDAMTQMHLGLREYIYDSTL